MMAGDGAFDPDPRATACSRAASKMATTVAVKQEPTALSSSSSGLVPAPPPPMEAGTENWKVSPPASIRPRLCLPPDQVTWLVNASSACLYLLTFWK